MDFPAKTDHDIIGTSYDYVLKMQAISVDDTYINLKGVMWESCSDDVGVSDDIIYIIMGYKGRHGRGAGLLRFQIPSSRVELIGLS